MKKNEIEISTEFVRDVEARRVNRIGTIVSISVSERIRERQTIRGGAK